MKDKSQHGTDAVMVVIQMDSKHRSVNTSALFSTDRLSPDRKAPENVCVTLQQGRLVTHYHQESLDSPRLISDCLYL